MAQARNRLYREPEIRKYKDIFNDNRVKSGAAETMAASDAALHKIPREYTPTLSFLLTRPQDASKLAEAHKRTFDEDAQRFQNKAEDGPPGYGSSSRRAK